MVALSRCRVVARLFAACAAMVAALAAPLGAFAASRVLDVAATATYVQFLTIPIGATRTFETISPPGVDSVLYLFADDGAGNLTLVGVHDDVDIQNGNFDASLTYTNTTAGTSFGVLLRAYGPGVAGVSTFSVDGVVQTTGGTHRRYARGRSTADIPGWR